MRSRSRRSLLWLAASASLTLACEQKAPAPQVELMVFAAASLKSAFEAAGTTFEGAHPGVDVRFNFAGTQELRRQLEFGAQADVLASADEKHMQALADEQLVLAPRVFAENEPVLAVAASAKSPIRDFADLPSALRLVVGAPEVPIGRYTVRLLDRAEQKYGATFRGLVESHIVSRELNVRQVLAKVTLGEADAAIVYRSDVTPPRPNVRTVAIPPDVNVIARYPIAVVTAAAQPELANAWIELLSAPPGQAALRDAGLRPIDEK